MQSPLGKLIDKRRATAGSITDGAVGALSADEDQLSLRQADQIRGDLYGIQDDLDFINRDRADS
jgi:hypothetical protein